MYCWSAVICGRRVGGTLRQSLNLVSDVSPVDFSIMACSFHPCNFKRWTRVVVFSSLRPQLRLACHAQGGPGNSLQPFFGDGLPAIATDTIRPILDACQRLLYFEEQRFLIVQNSLLHVCFLEIHRLFFQLYNAIAGLDRIFSLRGASSQ